MDLARRSSGSGNERISEARLVEYATKAGELLEHFRTATGVTGNAALEASFATITERLVAEVQRYRALLLGIADLDPADPEFLTCQFCEARTGEHAAEPHREGCPWPAFEAEVRAIREEQRE